ncbi:MAG: hypothetical protein K2J82_02320 [Muribaculaceae bacterium]|nr:hypothetical protein [Muribaculaceae bacterium]MDE6753426.1 hypothetical protein [Muribaculaceae bacterium]
MNKKEKLKILNVGLLPMTLAILASGIQLELTESSGTGSVWTHIGIGIVFMTMVVYHIYMHFGNSNWFARFSKLKSQFTRILWWVSLITLFSGVIAMIHWFVSQEHSPIGGIHGKIGFLMILMAIFHIGKRIKFFKG